MLEPEGLDDPFVEEIPVPHLHRQSWDAKWLASFDTRNAQLTLRSLSTKRPAKRAGKAFQVAVGGLGGWVETLRWMADGRGVVLATSGGLQLVRLDLSSPGRAVSAIPLFGSRQKSALDGEIVDFRIVPGGLIARTAHRLYYVYIDSRDRPVIHDLTPDGYRVRGAGALAGGRIAMAVVKLATKKDELWTLAPSSMGPARAPVVTSASPCPKCAATNWAPGSQWPIFAAGRNTVFMHKPDPAGSSSFYKLGLPGPRDLRVRSLWVSPDGTRILAANRETVQVWDLDGKVLWTWKQPGRGQEIRSARFAAAGSEGGQSVLIVTDKSVWRVRDGKVIGDVVTDALRERLDLHLDLGRQTYLESVVPLADGSIAFTRVRRTFITDEDFLGPEDIEALGATSKSAGH